MTESTGRLRPTRLLIESTAIFLSVLLAFFVEQWREGANEQRQAEDTLALVRAELSQNLAELEKVTATRDESLLGFQKAIVILRDENRFPDELPLFLSPEITNIAYELATDSGAVTSVPAEDLLVIARAYAALESVQANDRFLNERNAQIRFNDGEQYLSGFIYYINRAKFNEPAAVEAVRNAINALDERGSRD